MKSEMAQCTCRLHGTRTVRTTTAFPRHIPTYPGHITSVLMQLCKHIHVRRKESVNPEILARCNVEVRKAMHRLSS